jgi:hypothetical protein
MRCDKGAALLLPVTRNVSEQTRSWRHKERGEVYTLLFDQLCDRKTVVLQSYCTLVLTAPLPPLPRRPHPQ